MVERGGEVLGLVVLHAVLGEQVLEVERQDGAHPVVREPLAGLGTGGKEGKELVGCFHEI